jgi:hypothetical protein
MILLRLAILAVYSLHVFEYKLGMGILKWNFSLEYIFIYINIYAFIF